MSLSTFHTLQTAKSSLIAHQKGISVIGHNIANQANEDYSRQRIHLSTLPPVDAPGLTSRGGAGQFGQGVDVALIERIRDAFVDDKIFTQRGSTTYWETKEFYLRNLERFYNEPAGNGIKGLYDEFLNAWNSVAVDPTNRGARQTLQEVSKEFTQGINNLYENMTELRRRADSQIRDKVEVINLAAKEIAELNKKIELITADKKNANDLMDKRDALIEDISKLADVSVIRKDRDFLVFIGSQILVQGRNYRELQAVGNQNNSGLADVRWADNGLNVAIGDGELRGLIDIRDVDLVDQISKLDTFATNLITTVNDIHRQGFGLNGQTGIDFFSNRSLPLNLNGDYDRNGDGMADSTAIMKVSGTTSMKLDDKIGVRGVMHLGYSDEELKQVTAELQRLAGSTNPVDVAREKVLKMKEQELRNTQSIKVEYFETDTVHDVINRINASESNIVAYLNHNGQFTIKALQNEQKNKAYSDYIDAPDFAIKHLEDRRVDANGRETGESGFFLTTFTGILEKPTETGKIASYDWAKTGAINSFVTNKETGAIAVSYDVTPMTHPSSYISLSKEILFDVNNIATRMGKDNTGDNIPDLANGVGDNSNAWKIISTLSSAGERSQISAFKDKLDSDIVMLDKTNSSFKTYLDNMVFHAGSIARESVYESESSGVQMHHLINLRQEISGVNLDEELATMLTFEHAYRAATRIVNVVDSMIDTIVNKMGV